MICNINLYVTNDVTSKYMILWIAQILIYFTLLFYRANCKGISRI